MSEWQYLVEGRAIDRAEDRAAALIDGDNKPRMSVPCRHRGLEGDSVRRETFELRVRHHVDLFAYDRIAGDTRLVELIGLTLRDGGPHLLDSGCRVICIEVPDVLVTHDLTPAFVATNLLKASSASLLGREVGAADIEGDEARDPVSKW